jgi:hypothetical protein
VLIYYSGHGTQCVVADGYRRFSREALLPKDKKRGAEYRLLFDWELNALIASIAARTPAVTVVLDCCSSAGATRGLGGEARAGERFWRISETYRLPSGQTPSAVPVRGVAAALGTLQRCQIVAACRDDERARESAGDGSRANGELTRALLARLKAIPTSELADLRWGRIWRAVEADVRQANPHQSPWLSGNFGRRVFGFGPDEDTDPGFAIVQVPSGYRVDAGTLAGVTPDAEIGVYGAQPAALPPLGSPDDLQARSGIIRVTRAEPSACEGIAVAPFILPEAARGRLVRAGPVARLRVAVAPEDPGLAATISRSSLIELVERHNAELTLTRRPDRGWALTDDVHGAGEDPDEPMLAVIPPGRLDAARAVVEHYHGYVTPLRMARACNDLPSMLRLWALHCGEDTIAPGAAQNPDLPQVEPGTRAPYEIAHGDRVCFVIENASSVALSVTLLDCAASGRVLVLGEKRVPRRSTHVFWYGGTLGNPFVASLPDDRRLGVDRIVAIATTRSDVSLRYLERRQSFANVMSPAGGARAVASDRSTAEPTPESWTSVLTAVRIARPMSMGGRGVGASPKQL